MRDFVVAFFSAYKVRPPILQAIHHIMNHSQSYGDQPHSTMYLTPFAPLQNNTLQTNGPDRMPIAVTMPMAEPLVRSHSACLRHHLIKKPQTAGRQVHGTIRRRCSARA